MELNNAQSIVNEEDLGLWQKDTEGGLVNHPDTAKCWEDPRTIFNLVNIESCLQWFDKIKDMQDYTFIQFDVVDF